MQIKSFDRVKRFIHRHNLFELELNGTIQVVVSEEFKRPTSRALRNEFARAFHRAKLRRRLDNLSVKDDKGNFKEIGKVTDLKVNIRATQEG